MTEQFDLDFVLDLDSPLCGNAKNERTLMVYNWFALSREKQTELPIYDDGKACIEVKGTSYGVANIWDKVIFPQAGGHLNKLGMVRAEVIDGRHSTGVHRRVQGRGGAAGDGRGSSGASGRQRPGHP
jgi:hypothetical protein